MNSEDNFSIRLQEDITWRLRELSEVVRACAEGTDMRRAALSRSAIPVIYAHWEGYFVMAANSYLNFLAEKRTLLSAMRDEFWALSVRKKFKPQHVAGDVQFGRFLMSIKAEPDRVFKKGGFERINGKSNLSSEVLIYCCELLGLPTVAFEVYFEFIDTMLIDRRNFIAHGESLRFPPQEVPEYRDKVVDLMRITQTQFENAAVQKSYLKNV